MRKIKFRFWDDLHNKFWYGGQEGESVGNKTFQSYFKDGALVGMLLEPVSYGFKKVDDYQEHKLTPNLYTGREDENGKEIFEGDIVNLTYMVYTGHGTVDEVTEAIAIEDSTRLPFGPSTIGCEVIGNIYEDALNG